MKRFILTSLSLLSTLIALAQPSIHDGDEAGNYPLILALIMLAGALAYRFLKNKSVKI